MSEKPMAESSEQKTAPVSIPLRDYLADPVKDKRPGLRREEVQRWRDETAQLLRDGWNLVDVIADRESGPDVVPGLIHPRAPGLALTPCLEELDWRDDEVTGVGAVAITHVRTGRTLSKECRPVEAAADCALFIGPLADWTLMITPENHDTYRDAYRAYRPSSAVTA